MRFSTSVVLAVAAAAALPAFASPAGYFETLVARNKGSKLDKAPSHVNPAVGPHNLAVGLSHQLSG